MRRLIFLVVLLPLLILPVSGAQYSAPQAPEGASDLLPEEPETFGEGLWYVVKHAIAAVKPELAETAGICLGVVGILLLTTLLHAFPGESQSVAAMVGTVAVAGILLNPMHTLIRMGVETARQLSDYGKLLLPVMTAAMAAQGSGITSAALYTGTAVFDAALMQFLTYVVVPGLYGYLALAVASCALGDGALKKVQDFVKWLLTWGLKAVLYLFSGYMAITRVISGTADAAAVKAAKLAISGVVPVVGGMLSDASEAVLAGAGTVKGAVGLYGLLALLAIWIEPFLKIGIPYWMLKLTAALCGSFGPKQSTDFLQDFASAMGLLLAMVGTMCLLLLISTVCFIRGVG